MNKIKGVGGVEEVAPMSLVAGVVTYQGKPEGATIIGTYPNFNKALNIFNVSEGAMFKTVADGNVVAIGPKFKKNVFGDGKTVGKTVRIGKTDFKVIGVFGDIKASSIFGNQFDNVAIIPFNAAKKLNKDKIIINRIVVKLADNVKVSDLKSEIKKVILKNHGGVEDFSVLTQDDILGLMDSFLSLVTTLVSAIAAISLVVGGIGIMNIMLVTVTERTKEIGLRKAVGATRLAIAAQFLIEAIFVTLIGGLIGLLISFGIGAIVASKTPLKPVISFDIIIIAIGLSTVIGIIFGLWPALRAAKKDPIEALRYE
jgi:putative ABC transport system permease protein